MKEAVYAGCHHQTATHCDYCRSLRLTNFVLSTFVADEPLFVPDNNTTPHSSFSFSSTTTFQPFPFCCRNSPPSDPTTVSCRHQSSPTSSPTQAPSPLISLSTPTCRLR
ncbi:hypothetical protein AAZX31_19G214300 [Glycine max]